MCVCVSVCVGSGPGCISLSHCPVSPGTSCLSSLLNLCTVTPQSCRDSHTLRNEHLKNEPLYSKKQCFPVCGNFTYPSARLIEDLSVFFVLGNVRILSVLTWKFEMFFLFFFLCSLDLVFSTPLRIPLLKHSLLFQ